ncbi:MAG: ABC transporter substrate-binding protein, partial [Planctomycetota bacterium]
KAAPVFEEEHPGVDVDVQLVHGVAVTSRLRAAFWADLDVPDLVEVEISSAGTFFRGPLDDLGFMDWTPWLKRTGYYDRIVKTRFAPYTAKGHIFGLPHDVHPVMLAYNREAFEELGIEPEALTTWDAFIAAGRRVTVRRGTEQRYMIELSDSGSSALEVFLFQRGGGYFDAEGRLTMDDEIAFETVRWYVPLVAGKERIGNDVGGRDIFTRALESRLILSFLCPDWRSKSIETHVGSMKGKMALMPLPAFQPGGRRTSTRGGTMLGITRKCPHKQRAYELAKHLYLDPEELARRFRELNILPPLKDAWTLPEFDQPRAYWSGQPIGRLYADLAEDVPPQYTSPFIRLAKGKMGEVVSACAAYYRKHGDDGFDAYVRARLDEAADYVRTQMERNPF